MSMQMSVHRTTAFEVRFICKPLMKFPHWKAMHAGKTPQPLEIFVRMQLQRCQIRFLIREQCK